MSQRISYAQNFEDVILYRALSSVDKGCYIDIGAQSPVVDSVSRMFHDLGWRGVHVEPMDSYADELESARPGDEVMRVVLGESRGSMTFHAMPSTGLSTTDGNIAARHREEGFTIIDIDVPMITLDDVFDKAGFEQVHWLKIDVEGAEDLVIKGWRGDARPWVLVVESTLPLSQIQSHQGWEPHVLAKGYRFVYFDGLNRFYVSEEHRELADAFGPGANIFDDFALSGMASQPFTRVMADKVSAIQGQLDGKRSEIEGVHRELEAVMAEFATFRRGAVQTEMKLQVAAEALVRAEADAEATREALDHLNRQVIEISADRSEQARVAHYWWVTAETMRAELDRITSSRSWRFTAPLRGLRGGHFPFRVFLKNIMRSLLARIMVRVMRRPLLLRLARKALSLTPRLKDRLRRLAIRYGFIQDRAAITTLFDAPAHTAPKALSRKASKVFDDLNAAMKGKVD